MVLRLTKSSQRSICSCDYEKMKKHLFNGILSNTFTNNNPLAISINVSVHTDNHVAYVYLRINDTKIKQICQFVNDSFIRITNEFHL